MNSIIISWNKHSADEVQYLSNRQSFQQDVAEKTIDQEDKLKKKKVHFKCPTPPVIKHQGFENTEQNSSETNQTQRVSFEDYDYILPKSRNVFTSQLTTINEEPICSARAIVMTFIIIVVIIIIVAIAVGIVFGSIKTSRNATANTNQISFLKVLTTLSTTLMTSSISIGSQNGAPCLSYTTINDPSRNVAQIGSFGSCDNGLLFNTSNSGAWIRFVGSGGTEMALSSPGVNRCGGYITGWFNGTLPTTLGTMTNGSVCFTTDAWECLDSYESSIFYCTGSFYIYFLQPSSVCNARYCTI